ncbi:hypothetical protein VTO42DRAFT_4365 [Malbranchea cinnamomea]
MAPLLNGQDTRAYTTTALKRWSCLNNSEPLPAVSDIKAIHVYDFDNTLFQTPLPNPQLWSSQTIGFLQAYDSFATGGWWHDPNILASTGQGLEVEEPLGWKGWWNELIVQLVELSIKQKDALTVLLTGRAESSFADLIKRIVKSRNLQFDLICLKPEVGPNSQRFSTTMNFKQTFLEDLVLTYKQADEIRVYEDRIKHVKGFREYFEQLNRNLSSSSPAPRKPLTAEVIHVSEEAGYLVPTTEAAEIQRMINAHNMSYAHPDRNITKSPYGRLQIRKMTFFTGYLLSNADSARLIKYILNPLLPPGLADSGDLKLMANSIVITAREAPKALLDKVGGLGHIVRWRVTGTAVLENRLWAAKVTPISETEVIHTENPEPIVVLAVRKGTRPFDASRIRNWQPVSGDDALVFDSEVGEKMVLRIDPDESDWEASYVRKGGSNKRGPRAELAAEDIPPTQPREQRDTTRGGRQNYHTYARHGGGFPEDGPRRGGGGAYRGSRGRGSRGGRGGGRGRGRGGPPGGYRSLDDCATVPPYDGITDERGPGGGGEPVMNY